jgi:hypothetical protein
MGMILILGHRGVCKKEMLHRDISAITLKPLRGTEEFLLTSIRRLMGLMAQLRQKKARCVDPGQLNT